MLLRLSYRHWLKLLSLIFPLGLIWLPSRVVSLQIGILVFASFSFDILRLLNKKLNEEYLKFPNFSKIKEKNRFSGYTTFFLASFIVINYFPKEIAFISLVSFTLGDIFAPFSSRIRFLPKKKIVGEKTLGGFILITILAICACLVLSLITPFNLSFRFIIIGAFLTAIFDQLSFTIDDNLVVPIGTAVVLQFVGL